MTKYFALLSLLSLPFLVSCGNNYYYNYENKDLASQVSFPKDGVYINSVDIDIKNSKTPSSSSRYMNNDEANEFTKENIVKKSIEDGIYRELKDLSDSSSIYYYDIKMTYYRHFMPFSDKSIDGIVLTDLDIKVSKDGKEFARKSLKGSISNPVACGTSSNLIVNLIVLPIDILKTFAYLKKEKDDSYRIKKCSDTIYNTIKHLGN